MPAAQLSVKRDAVRARPTKTLRVSNYTQEGLFVAPRADVPTGIGKPDRRDTTRITCACGATWTGPSRAHCSGCHDTFSGVTAFETHRNRKGCVDPVSVGLVRRDGLWSYPTDPAHVAYWRARHAGD